MYLALYNVVRMSDQHTRSRGDGEGLSMESFQMTPEKCRNAVVNHSLHGSDPEPCN